MTGQPLTSEEAGIPLESLARAVESAAARRALLRLRARVIDEITAAVERSGGDARTAPGRRASSLREVLLLLELEGAPNPDLPGEELVGSLHGDCQDWIGVGLYIDDDEPAPVRLRVVDCSDRTADAYLTSAETDRLIAFLTEARDRATPPA